MNTHSKIDQIENTYVNGVKTVGSVCTKTLSVSNVTENEAELRHVNADIAKENILLYGQQCFTGK